VGTLAAMTDAWRLSAIDAGRQLAARELSSVELVSACLERIAAREPELRAWAHLDSQLALAEARERDDEERRGPLHGLPVGVKDVIDTADLPTAYGSPIYAGHRPDRDADCVAWLREAGAVVLGKTVTTEFATYEPPPTANPLDPARTPGGSSSGSAAAVAAGMVPLAYGTQTAGSVIRPASFCGVAGFKPAHGWRSTTGIKRLSERLDTLGLFGRSVAETALLGGFEAPSPREGRVAFCRTPWWDALEDGGRAALEEAAARLGAEEVELPAEFAGLAAAQETVMAFDVARNLEPEWREHREQLSRAMRDYLERGRKVSDADADAGAAAGERCRSLLPDVFRGFDALLVPAALGEAPLLVEGHTGDPLACRAWTFLGVPALSVPGMVGPAGMPVGVQLVGLDADAVLGAGVWVESVLASAAGAG
jgi:Asp-tRNA(Asn)/Glu-tRNA(Gln) amidotransferase A subunit family amidase